MAVFASEGESSMKRFVSLLAVAFAALLPMVVVAQDSDTNAPVLVNLVIDPDQIDTSASDQTVTLSVDVTDDLSGYSYGYAYLYSPSGQVWVYAYLGEPVSGTPLDGRFRGYLTIPRYSEAGTWTLSSLILYDRTGNALQLDAAALAAGGFPNALQVVSSDPDTAPPDLIGLSVAPTAVDVSAAAQTLTFTLDVLDDKSGLDVPPQPNRDLNHLVELYSPSRRQYVWAHYADAVLVDGPNADGAYRYEISVKMPRYAEPGDWVIIVNLTDRAGNSRYYDSSFADPPWPGASPTRVTVTSNPADTTLPVIGSAGVSPSLINTSSGDRSVDFTLALRDDLSGLGPLQIGNVLYCFAYGFFYSPSGQQSRTACLYNDAQLIAGTRLNGTWKTSVFFPQYSEEGTWNLTVLSVRDQAGNFRYLNAADLAAAGLATQIQVIKPSLEVDGSIGPGGGTVEDATFGDRAQVTAPPGAFAEPTDVKIDVLREPLQIPSPQGFGAAGSLYVNIELVPKPSYPLPAPGLTITIPLIETNPPAPGTNLTLFRVNPATGALVPAFGLNGQPVVGTVNADGRSATFTGIISLSTVVALARLAEVVGDVNLDGQVNCADLKLVRSAFGKRSGQVGYDYRADANRNGVIDINDLAYVSRALPAGTKCQ